MFFLNVSTLFKKFITCFVQMFGNLRMKDFGTVFVKWLMLIGAKIGWLFCQGRQWFRLRCSHPAPGRQPINQ